MRDFADIVYSYAVNGTQDQTLHRKSFLEYIHELTPSKEALEHQPFEQQAKGMMSEMDALRNGTLTL